MGEELRVGEIEKARAVISHHIGHAWNEVVERHVAMMTLVEGLESQEVGNWAGGGGGAFALPRHCGGVV
jgi:hypothetical protein